MGGGTGDGAENWPPVCDQCGLVLTEPGALLFAPPSEGVARKWHICKSCFENTVVLLLGLVT